MRLYEFDQPDPLVPKIIAVSDQLKSDLESGEVQPNWTTDELLNYFQQYGVDLDIQDLYSMIKKPPMQNIITNIQGDNVVFRGFAPGEDAPEDEQKKIVKSMAKQAQK